MPGFRICANVGRRAAGGRSCQRWRLSEKRTRFKTCDQRGQSPRGDCDALPALGFEVTGVDSLPTLAAVRGWIRSETESHLCQRWHPDRAGFERADRQRWPLWSELVL